jgi:hypothetical protein
MFTVVTSNKLHPPQRTAPAVPDCTNMLFVTHQNLRSEIQTILTKIESKFLRELILAKETIG